MLFCHSLDRSSYLEDIHHNKWIITSLLMSVNASGRLGTPVVGISIGSGRGVERNGGKQLILLVLALILALDSAVVQHVGT